MRISNADLKFRMEAVYQYTDDVNYSKLATAAAAVSQQLFSLSTYSQITVMCEKTISAIDLKGQLILGSSKCNGEWLGASCRILENNKLYFDFQGSGEANGIAVIILGDRQFRGISIYTLTEETKENHLP